ncbi:hypothetical protein SETIT_9G499600v2 [Setaria italica]|uniref:F-box domain-containing protein n=1 Tax=Setaria italica TaxID=4555 RepID=A0A368SWD1_SETIT|nr:putative F-box/LRR-repeat protein At3g18150 [Setaria italica]RCV46030.1 hypothetical protein SETIT_9G499600v2 [Setaria italica]
MESSDVQNHDEDRISKLPDDILLAILEKVSISTVIKTSILSTRWGHLPLLLSHLCLEAEHFMPQNSTTVVDYKLVREAMEALIKLMSSFLASPKRESNIRTLSLRVGLVTNLLLDIGKLVCNAIDSGKLKNLELEIPTVKCSRYSNEKDMQEHAQSLMFFFDSSPRLFGCLTKLFLYNASFTEPDMHRLLLSCEQLQNLILHDCDIGFLSVLKMDLPNSKLRALELCSCSFERVQLICLPKLVQLQCKHWDSYTFPVSFSFVPCLEEVKLICTALSRHARFKITELLGDTTNVQALTLNFHGEKIWIAPEGKELQNSFKTLRKLFLHGIYVEFDLLWTLVLLESAPSVQIFGIKIWNHICGKDTQRREICSERTIGSWSTTKLGGSTSFLQLKRLEFGGFQQVKQHLDLIRTVIKRAPNLETLLLEDKKYCQKCEAVTNSVCSSKTSMFRKNEEDILVKQFGTGDVSRPIQIIFRPLQC